MIRAALFLVVLLFAGRVVVTFLADTPPLVSIEHSHEALLPQDFQGTIIVAKNNANRAVPYLVSDAFGPLVRTKALIFSSESKCGSYSGEKACADFIRTLDGHAVHVRGGIQAEHVLVYQLKVSGLPT